MFRNARPFAARRRARRRRAQATTTTESRRTITFDRILALPAVDRVFERLLTHPHALQWVGMLVGLLMVVLALSPLALPSLRPVAPQQQTVAAPAMAAPQMAANPPSEQEVLAVVAAYNQASITAAVLNKADPMAPYLAADGQAWAEVQAEYGRRATRGETHDPALTRWGVLNSVVDGDIATVETQEQWDDITSVGGQVISSRRAVLTRNHYELRRSPGLGRWLITTVTSAVIIG
jgi:hypothetical protein